MTLENGEIVNFDTPQNYLKIKTVYFMNYILNELYKIGITFIIKTFKNLIETNNFFFFEKQFKY